MSKPATEITLNGQRAPRYAGSTAHWVLALLFAVIFSRFGIKRFEPWPQVLELWESGVSPLLLAVSGHPHFFRFMTSYVGFLLEEAYPLMGFSFYVSIFFAANVLLWRKVAFLSNGRAPSAVAWTVFLAAHFFMNGRGVIAWTAWLLCVWLCLMQARGEPRRLKGLLLTALTCWLAAVSTGVFVVAVIAFVLFRFHYKGRRRTGIFTKGLGLVISVPVLYVIANYFVVAVTKNIDFYGGGLQGLFGMLAHGVGKVLFGSEIMAVLIVSLSAFTLMFFVMLLKLRKQAFTPMEKLIACAVFGGLFGFTVLTLAVPLVLLYRPKTTSRAATPDCLGDRHTT